MGEGVKRVERALSPDKEREGDCVHDVLGGDGGLHLAERLEIVGDGVGLVEYCHALDSGDVQGYDLCRVAKTTCNGDGVAALVAFHEAYEVWGKLGLLDRGVPVLLAGMDDSDYSTRDPCVDQDLKGLVLEGVSGVAAFSGFNMPSEMMYASTELNTSKAMILMKPSMQLGISAAYGQESFYAAETSIKKHKDIPYFIIHGDKDTTIPLNHVSIYDNVYKDNYSNVTAVKLEGMTHGTPWKTLEAVKYTSEYEQGLKDLRKQYKGKLPDEVKEEYIASIDKEKASAVNTSLLEQIDEMFTSKI